MDRNARSALNTVDTATTQPVPCDTLSDDCVKDLPQTSDSADRKFTAGNVSRKSASADYVDDTGCNDEEVRHASSEHNTTSCRRFRRTRLMNHHCTGCRHRLTRSTRQRHVTESPIVTSSGISQGATSSSDPPEEPAGMVVTSSAVRPRGRTSCKNNHRTELPGVTSSRESREPPRCVSGAQLEKFPPQQVKKSDKQLQQRQCIRSTSVPPPSTVRSNPFSPFWNFVFKDQSPASWIDDIYHADAEEDHVCNTVNSPRTAWFGTASVITNIYLSTMNRWTGVWPTLASYVAPPGERKQTNDRCPLSLHHGHPTTNPSQVSNRYHFDDQIPLHWPYHSHLSAACLV